MRRLDRQLLLATVVASAVFGACCSPAFAQTSFAPLEQPGPALTPTAAQLSASLECEPSVRQAKVEPVLLNPGTGTTATENFGWNWEPALDMLGIPWCAYTPPNYTLGAIDVSGEYLVYAIRTMYALAGRKIAILGHSQGGMSMRWALRFWPDTRTMVEDIVGLAATNHGTTAATASDCESLGCVPADWQQISNSNFVAALNSRALAFPGISYTEIYTTHDELSTPASGPGNCTTCLPPAPGQIANVELQSICPNDPSEHLLIGTTDPVAYALGVDAITHPGPADAARIPPSVCSQLFMPGVMSPASASGGLGAFFAAPGTLGIVPGPLPNPISGAPVLFSEPPLPCYVFATCPPSAPLHVQVTPSRVKAHRPVRLGILVTVDVGGVVLPVPDASGWVGNDRHRYRTAQDGRTTVTLSFGKGGRRHVMATDPEYFTGTAVVVVHARKKAHHARRRSLLAAA